MPYPEQGLPSGESLSTYDRAVAGLINKALTLINYEYGPDGRNPKSYHGLEHTRMVIHSASLLADAAMEHGKISLRQKNLLLIAAAFHDVVHDSNSSDSEELSAEIAVRHMRFVELFTADEILMVEEAILATKVRAVSSDRIEQSAEDKQGYIARLLADADLSTFGSPVETYWPMAQRFFAERNPGVELQAEELREFARKQLVLVNNHQFYTEEARQVFNSQPQIAEFLQSLVAA